MNEYEKRKEAIRRYNTGEKITFIVKSLKKTRQWFYNWLARYKERVDDESWYIGYSTAPREKPTKVKKSVENQVIQIRQKLEDQHFAQTGAIAIQYDWSLTLSRLVKITTN